MSDNNEGEEVVWWLKWATRGVGALGAVASGVCGILVIVENILTPTCIASGAIMCLLSFLLFVFEATFCCAKVSAAQPLITRMEKLRFWHRAALYCGLSVLSLGLCFSAPLTHVFGLLGGFACGVLYGIMSLGKKADQSAMAATASGNQGNNYKQFDNEDP